MKVYGIEREQLLKALGEVSLRYDGNVIFDKYPEMFNKKPNNFTFTIRTKNSYEKGARRSWTGRRMPKACWYVHGELFDLLFTMGATKITTGFAKPMLSKSDNWQDYQIGSVMQPALMSGACDCH